LRLRVQVPERLSAKERELYEQLQALSGTGSPRRSRKLGG
jgi:hypothetical protein